MTQPSNHSYVNARVLRINVGFVTVEGVGFSREIEFSVPSLLKVAEDLTLGHFYATVRLSKTRDGVLVQGNVQTSVADQCSRCADDVWIPIEFEIEELFATSADLDTEFRVDDAMLLDLAPLIREEAWLHVPMGTPTDAEGRCMFCNRTLKDVLRERGLEDEIDPRFEALKTVRDRFEGKEE